MAQNNWLTLMDYSSRYKVSISTLRRRIKSGELEHQFVDGKYYLLDNSLPTQKPASGPETIVPPPKISQDQEPKAHICPTAEELLHEVKRAYSMVLQEKEEQILQLREEVSDLQTLVRVLENEVHRLNQVVKDKEALLNQNKKTPAPQRAERVESSSALGMDLNLELDRF